MPSALRTGWRKRFVPAPAFFAAEAEKGRLSVLYPYRKAVEIGGLMAYGFDFTDAGRGAADATAQILKGAKPGEIPFAQPTKFELSVNLKSAKALGIEIPGSLLARADEVIE